MTKQTFIQGELVYYARGIDEKNIREVAITSITEDDYLDPSYYYRDQYGTHLATGDILFKTLKEAKDKIQLDRLAFINKVEQVIQTPEDAARFLWENNKQYLASESKLIYKKRIEQVLNVTLN